MCLVLTAPVLVVSAPFKRMLLAFTTAVHSPPLSARSPTYGYQPSERTQSSSCYCIRNNPNPLTDIQICASSPRAHRDYSSSPRRLANLIGATCRLAVPNRSSPAAPTPDARRSLDDLQSTEKLRRQPFLLLSRQPTFCFLFCTAGVLPESSAMFSSTTRQEAKAVDHVGAVA